MNGIADQAAVDRRTVLQIGAAAMLADGLRSPPMTIDRPVAVLADAIEDIARYAQSHIAGYALPGLAVSLVVAGYPPVTLSGGFADREQRTRLHPGHLLQIGSIGKSFTALCIFQLVQEGAFALGDQVAALLPGVPIDGGDGVTVQHLLNHSSGLPNAAPLWPRGGSGNLWLGFRPGESFSYSNTGYALLSQLLVKFEQSPLRAIIARRILHPLGMTASRASVVSTERSRYAIGYGPAITSQVFGGESYPMSAPMAVAPWVDLDSGAGCVAATTQDMAMYMRFLLSAARGDAAPLLSRASAARFFAPAIAAPTLGAGARYANGLAILRAHGGSRMHHTGGTLSFGSAMDLDVARGIGAFASTNLGSVAYRPTPITAFACDRIRQHLDGGAPAIAPAVPAAAATPANLAGSYRSRIGRTMIITVAPATMAAHIDGRSIRLEPFQGDAFMASDPTALSDPIVFAQPGRAWLGSEEWLRDDAAVTFAADPPSEIAALRGFYESDDPWHGACRVTSQGPALYLDGVAPLMAIAPRHYRVGDAPSPERISFEAFVDGIPQRAVISGVDHVRRDL